MKQVIKWGGRVALVFFLAVLLIFIAVNWASLDDGVAFLQSMVSYQPTPAHPIDPQGPFGFCEAYMGLRNAQRAQFIVNYLDERGIAYQRLPIYNTKFDNIFIPFGTAGPYTLFSAHYDKVYDDPEYQGASDNSAADCMLLVAASELSKQPPQKHTGILLTGEEEVGLVGAQAFYDCAVKNNMQIASVFNFDNIGRAGLAVRASGDRSGYAFTIPLLGEFIYDGRTLAPALPYRQPDPGMIEQIRHIVPLTQYDRMIARGDGTFWQNQGWNAVNISTDDTYYLDLTWHTYADRAELLDQSNLQRAVQMVTGLAQAGS